MKAITRYLFLFPLFILILLCSCTNKKDCSQLKKGQFFYKNKVTALGSVIERVDSLQIVVYIANGRIDTERVKWLEPCVYELKPISKLLDSAGETALPMKVSILDITKEYYTVSVYSESEKSAFSDTIWIIKSGAKSGEDHFKKN